MPSQLRSRSSASDLAFAPVVTPGAEQDDVAIDVAEVLLAIVRQALEASRVRRTRIIRSTGMPESERNGGEDAPAIAATATGQVVLPEALARTWLNPGFMWD